MQRPLIRLLAAGPAIKRQSGSGYVQSRRIPAYIATGILSNISSTSTISNHLLPASTSLLSTSTKPRHTAALSLEPDAIVQQPPPLTLTWPHSGWKEQTIQDIVPTHRPPRTFGDRVAWRMVRLCR
jgi:hypothetical protein